MKNLKTCPTLIALTFFLIIFSSLPAKAEEVPQKTHTVVKGDTLWDISEHYLGNPFLWPKLWQWNDFISNPHFIYPGNIINIFPPAIMVKHPPKPPEPVVEEAPPVVEAAPEPEPVPEPEPMKYRFSQIRSSGLLSENDYKGAGKIIEAEDEKIMLSDDDLLYISINGQVAAGDLFTVFKTEEKIKHPSTKKVLGYKIKTMGTLKAKEDSNSQGLAKAVVIDSFDAITRGDPITPKEDIPEEIAIVKTNPGINGFIVAGREDRANFGQGDVIYIDLGTQDGVVTGNTFVVYRAGETIKDKKEKRSYTLPETTIGKLLVLHAKGNTSVAIILESIQEMKIGETIKSAGN